jgi:pyruvate/2-oxoglutarate dehydrogenase complex dihydrolipoamide dehydrogenase (E3) component
VLERLKAEGVNIMARTAIAEVSQTGDGIAVKTREHGTVTGSHLLVAAGRRPNIEELNLEAAGIAFTSKGITVDDGLRTSNPKVYAVGDVAGRQQFTHVAGYHAGLVIRNALFGLPVKANAVIPWVTYTDPELAHAGLNEADALKKHGAHVKVLRWPYHDNDRAQAEGRTDGFVKVVTGRRGRILGVGIVGAEAGELILPWVLAMSQGLKISAMAQLVAPYPTRSEASRRVAISYFADFSSNSWVRRVISLVKTLRP